MVAAQEVMLEIGLIMLVAFIGAAIASRAKQSVIIGYIIAGIFIGPHMNFDLFGMTYQGFVGDTSFIDYMSKIGLTLLMFFVGLEFSITKLKKTKAPAILLALVNTGLDMFIGIMIGLALGWPLVDTVFLAGVVAMGSAAITGKSLMELKKFSNPETEFLLGMVVVEDFISMILLTIAGGLVIKSGGVGLGGTDLIHMLVGVGAFYAFFIIIAIWIIPRVSVHLTKIRSDELFVLFGLGMVFISSALAEFCGVPSIIGAFFMGMVFAETKIADRLETKLGSIRDAFVAIFFVLFGMLIDPALFPSIMWIVAIAVPMVIIGDLFVTGALAFLLGFSGRAATSMGASMCGRGAESVMYASVGSTAVNATKGAELYPFAGAFCFILSVITPVMMRFSDKIYRGISRVLPRNVKHGAAVISRTLGKIVLPAPLRLYKRGRRIELALVLYFIMLIAVAAADGLLHLALFGAGVALTVWILYMVEMELRPIVRTINYENLGVTSRDGSTISRFVSMFIFTSLLVMLVISFVFTYLWWLTLVAVFVYFIGSMSMMGHYSKRLRAPDFFSQKVERKAEAANPFAARAPTPPFHSKEEEEAHRDFLRVHRPQENGKQKKW
ncbi:MAG: cation:proton antiporter [Methanomassiliicoccales archaeon]|nr:cation:proton antiporter [Methanomassiliicoccales archaeon]